MHSLVELTASPFVSRHCFFDATRESQRLKEQPGVYGARQPPIQPPHMRDLVSLVFRYAAHFQQLSERAQMAAGGQREREKKEEQKKREERRKRRKRKRRPGGLPAIRRRD